MIGLLVPLKHKRKSRKHRTKRSSHHRQEGSSRREQHHRQEKGDLKDLSHFPEDTLARLYMSLEQTFIEESLRGRSGEERLDKLASGPAELEGERERGRSEEARRNSLGGDTARSSSTSTDIRFQTGVPNNPEYRNADAVGSACGCRCCCCARYARAEIRYPTVPELDGGRDEGFKNGPGTGVYTASCVERRRRWVVAGSGPPSP